jgi:hypothetical protein
MKAGIVMHKIIVAGEAKYLLFSSELLLQKFYITGKNWNQLFLKMLKI